MTMQLKEPITVGAVFGPGSTKSGSLKPAWFSWRGRRYRVEEVTYTWESFEGEARMMHFAVVSGANVYAISYNPVTHGWQIRGVEQDWRG